MTTQVTNVSEDRVEHKGGNGVVTYIEPYTIEVQLQGIDDLLMNRYDIEDVEAKGRAKKGSIEKKTDNLEAMVYRDRDGIIGIPGTMLKASIREAGRRMQDPSNKRKSARDLFRAGIKIPGMGSFGKETWDYVDRRPVVIKMARVPKSRPAFHAGWQANFSIEVLAYELITPDFLHEALLIAGKFQGLGTYRPDFGTFNVNSFQVRELED